MTNNPILTDKQRLAIEREALLHAGSRSLTFREFMATKVHPRYAHVPPHLVPFYDLIERTRHEQIFAIVTMPPRHGKSITMRGALAWKIYESPGCLNGYASYGQDLSDVTSLQVRKIVERLGVDLQRTKLRDFTTHLDGGLLTTSVGGSFTGRGLNGGLLGLDDLLKGRAEAENKRIRDATWEWLKDDALSRLEGGSSCILTTTRWHSDDVAGRLLRDGLGYKWIYINLPAIGWDGEPVDEREAEEYDPLWEGIDATNPTREGALAHYARARARGEYGWWSLYQGVPRSRESQIFRSPSFHEPCPLNGAVYIACDPAASANTKSDYTVVAAISVTGHGDTMNGKLIGAIRGQWDITEIPRKIFDFARQWPGAPVAVESVGAFRGIVGTLRSMDSRLRLIKIGARDERDTGSRLNGYMPIVGDKVQRAAPVAAAWNDGRFSLPLGAKWAEPIINEAIEFTGVDDAHDDCVDAIAHAWSFAQWDRARATAGAQRGSVVDPRWR